MKKIFIALVCVLALGKGIVAHPVFNDNNRMINQLPQIQQEEACEEVCAICREGNVDNNQDFQPLMKCGHHFHLRKCLRHWINMGHENSEKCPCCRADILESEELRDEDIQRQNREERQAQELRNEKAQLFGQKQDFLDQKQEQLEQQFIKEQEQLLKDIRENRSLVSVEEIEDLCLRLKDLSLNENQPVLSDEELADLCERMRGFSLEDEPENVRPLETMFHPGRTSTRRLQERVVRRLREARRQEFLQQETGSWGDGELETMFYQGRTNIRNFQRRRLREHRERRRLEFLQQETGPFAYEQIEDVEMPDAPNMASDEIVNEETEDIEISDAPNMMSDEVVDEEAGDVEMQDVPAAYQQENSYSIRFNGELPDERLAAFQNYNSSEDSQGELLNQSVLDDDTSSEDQNTYRLHIQGELPDERLAAFACLDDERKALERGLLANALLSEEHQEEELEEETDSGVQLDVEQSTQESEEAKALVVYVPNAPKEPAVTVSLKSEPAKKQPEEKILALQAPKPETNNKKVLLKGEKAQEKMLALEAPKTDDKKVSLKGVDTLEVESDVCSICYEGLCTGKVVELKPCGHKLHEQCMIDLAKSDCDTNNRCPLCRKQYEQYGQHCVPGHHHPHGNDPKNDPKKDPKKKKDKKKKGFEPVDMDYLLQEHYRLEELRKAIIATRKMRAILAVLRNTKKEDPKKVEQKEKPKKIKKKKKKKKKRKKKRTKRKVLKKVKKIVVQKAPVVKPTEKPVKPKKKAKKKKTRKRRVQRVLNMYRKRLNRDYVLPNAQLKLNKKPVVINDEETRTLPNTRLELDEKPVTPPVETVVVQPKKKPGFWSRLWNIIVDLSYAAHEVCGEIRGDNFLED